MKKSYIKRIFTTLWVLNILLIVLIVGYLVKFSPIPLSSLIRSPTPTASSTSTSTTTSTRTHTQTYTTTFTPQDTATPTLSLTPTFTYTPSETPLPFSEGPIVIGFSVESRPLEVYRFGTGDNEKLIVAGMHGGSEYNTILLANELIAYITDNPEIIPEDARLFILRNLNPDGEARSHSYLGRANTNNVDLNRNWDANWQKDWPRANCWPTYITSGTGPGSEPETQALMAFILAHDFDAIINYHSAALGIFPGGLPPEAETYSLAEAVASVSTYPYPPLNIGCVYTGGFTDWADEHGFPALDIELTNHTDTDFEMNLEILNVLLTWQP